MALDIPRRTDVIRWVDLLGDDIQWYKIGLELFCAEGPAVLEPLKARGKKIFLDLKLHDIPRTVERAVGSAAGHGADLITIHAAGGRAMMRAAANAAAACNAANKPRLLAVTVLTSLDETDFTDIGLLRSPGEQVQAMAMMAVDEGIDGVVCSPLEAKQLRSLLGTEPLLVTPGIRLPGSAADDQKRMATPAAAVQAGASHLVVGRPVLESADPQASARKILAEMEA